MFTFNGFTKNANRSLNSSIKIASELGHTYIGSEHILYGLISECTGVAWIILNKKGITKSIIKSKLEKEIGVGVKSSLNSDDFSPRSKTILETAIKKSKILNHSGVGTEHILLAMLKEKECCASIFLGDLGIDINNLYREILTEITFVKYNSTIGTEHKKNSVLEKYSKDLTALAKENKLDPIIGREREISRVVQILTRRSKNNVCVIGEPGVGKTAIAEGLAQKIVNNDIPEILSNKRILSLDLTSMLAGAKYRGDFEERIKNFINEVIKAQNIILFIDELHTIMGTGAAEGAIDAANMLKPQLARGEIQLIGATTFDEYKKNIEKDSALERRFQSITIDEPTEDEAIKIIRGIKSKYENYHNVTITDDAIVHAVQLSKRYITERFLPDKAIDVIDEACSKLAIEIDLKPLVIKEYEKYLEKLKTEKIEALDNKNLILSAKIKEKEQEIKNRIAHENKIWNIIKLKKTREITKENITETISDICKVPLNKIKESDSNKLLNLENNLSKRVIGQEEAIKKVSKSIRRSRTGLRDPNRPIGSFIFLGPTGVGKTELSKALAELLFGNEQAIVRFDMSEYMDKHSISKFIGSSPGYVGFEEGGQLTEIVRRKPYSIILFDEIEKAHHEIFNILLQVLDEGILTDSKGKKINFKNTIIIMTSNIGSENITNDVSMGFSNSKQDTDKKINQNIHSELKKYFRPEFINRVDEIIIFNKLMRKDAEKITKKMLESLKNRVLELGFQIDITENTISKIAEKGFNEKYGARPIKKEIVDLIEDKLAEKLIKGDLKQNDKLIIDCKDDEFTFNVQN